MVVNGCKDIFNALLQHMLQLQCLLKIHVGFFLIISFIQNIYFGHKNVSYMTELHFMT